MNNSGGKKPDKKTAHRRLLVHRELDSVVLARAGSRRYAPDRLQRIYDPRLSNDRLLLGLRGSMSEFELNILRTALVGRHPEEHAAW